jgi:hypothetical protein
MLFPEEVYVHIHSKEKKNQADCRQSKNILLYSITHLHVGCCVVQVQGGAKDDVFNVPEPASVNYM